MGSSKKDKSGEEKPSKSSKKDKSSKKADEKVKRDKKKTLSEANEDAGIIQNIHDFSNHLEEGGMGQHLEESGLLTATKVTEEPEDWSSDLEQEEPDKEEEP